MPIDKWNKIKLRKRPMICDKEASGFSGGSSKINYLVDPIGVTGSLDEDE